jgi:hypothetical protein
VSAVAVPAGYASSWTSGTVPAGAVQEVTIRFSPTEERAYTGTVTVSGDQTSGSNAVNISGAGTRAPGPRATFDVGTYLVGSEIASGRYYSDPSRTCAWERLSGLGGSAPERTANEYIGFDAGQWIVDILPGDHAFKTSSACETWFPTERRGLEAGITPGVWLVGRQVSPGTYRAAAAEGCYWARLRDFEGTFDGVIANDFVIDAAQQLVEISAGDAGFSSDEECGRWTRVAALTSASPAAPSGIESRPSRSHILDEWERHRSRSRAR